ncbi:hypothetical protein J6590_028983 [Homalodisca vitripennis]|nr:hypothetical protein J6590_028983 [Homalodisca vitripennis]
MQSPVFVSNILGWLAHCSRRRCIDTKSVIGESLQKHAVGCRPRVVLTTDNRVVFTTGDRRVTTKGRSRLSAESRVYDRTQSVVGRESCLRPVIGESLKKDAVGCRPRVVFTTGDRESLQKDTVGCRPRDDGVGRESCLRPVIGESLQKDVVGCRPRVVFTTGDRRVTTKGHSRLSAESRVYDRTQSVVGRESCLRPVIGESLQKDVVGCRPRNVFTTGDRRITTKGRSRLSAESRVYDR